MHWIIPPWVVQRFRFREKHDFLSFRRSVQSFVGRSASGWSECERFGGRFCSKCDQHCDAWIVTTICRYLKSLFCSLEPFDRTSCTALKLGFWLSHMNSMLQRSSSIRLWRRWILMRSSSTCRWNTIRYSWMFTWSCRVIGERGSGISGGQKQVAMALVYKIANCNCSKSSAKPKSDHFRWTYFVAVRIWIYR